MLANRHFKVKSGGNMTLLILAVCYITPQVRDSIIGYWQYRLGEQIKDVIIIEEKGIPQVKGVITQNELRFVNEKGEFINNIPLIDTLQTIENIRFFGGSRICTTFVVVHKKLEISKNGLYIGLNIPIELVKTNVGYKVARYEFIMMDNQGKNLWTWEGKRGAFSTYYGIPSPNGKYAICKPIFFETEFNVPILVVTPTYQKEIWIQKGSRFRNFDFNFSKASPSFWWYSVSTGRPWEIKILKIDSLICTISITDKDVRKMWQATIGKAPPSSILEWQWYPPTEKIFWPLKLRAKARIEIFQNADSIEINLYASESPPATLYPRSAIFKCIFNKNGRLLHYRGKITQ